MSEATQPLPVQINEIPLANGKVAGQLTLNKPKALNALDLEMAELMLGALHAWAQREEVLFVLLDASGDKAFCAGGDIVSMYQAMEQASNEIPPFVKTFFTLEYTLDHTLRTYAKPVVAWGHGIVMGGGMGLISGVSHRVVTSQSRLAMPEITIGLYPDVGGSYFLPRMPDNTGLFLGLTGASINATDAMEVGLADHYCEHDSKQAVLLALSEQDLSTANVADVLSDILQQHECAAGNRVDSHLKPLQSQISKACSASALDTIVDNILALDANDNKWLSKAQQSLAKGSPITAHLVYQQIQRGQSMSLAECFRMELGISCRCAEYGEFKEGIRALLIDKDNDPQWKFVDVNRVPDDVVDYFFSPVWSNEDHPLAALGE